MRELDQTPRASDAARDPSLLKGKGGSAAAKKAALRQAPAPGEVGSIIDATEETQRSTTPPKKAWYASTGLRRRLHRRSAEQDQAAAESAQDATAGIGAQQPRARLLAKIAAGLVASVVIGVLAAALMGPAPPPEAAQQLPADILQFMRSQSAWHEVSREELEQSTPFPYTIPTPQECATSQLPAVLELCARVAEATADHAAASSPNPYGATDELASLDLDCTSTANAAACQQAAASNSYDGHVDVDASLLLAHEAPGQRSPDVLDFMRSQSAWHEVSFDELGHADLEAPVAPSPEECANSNLPAVQALCIAAEEAAVAGQPLPPAGQQSSSTDPLSSLDLDCGAAGNEAACQQAANANSYEGEADVDPELLKAHEAPSAVPIDENSLDSLNLDCAANPGACAAAASVNTYEGDGYTALNPEFSRAWLKQEAAAVAAALAAEEASDLHTLDLDCSRAGQDADMAAACALAAAANSYEGAPESLLQQRRAAEQARAEDVMNLGMLDLDCSAGDEATQAECARALATNSYESAPVEPGSADAIAAHVASAAAFYSSASRTTGYDAPAQEWDPIAAQAAHAGLGGSPGGAKKGAHHGSSCGCGADHDAAGLEAHAAEHATPVHEAPKQRLYYKNPANAPGARVYYKNAANDPANKLYFKNMANAPVGHQQDVPLPAPQQEASPWPIAPVLLSLLLALGSTGFLVARHMGARRAPSPDAGKAEEPSDAGEEEPAPAALEPLAVPDSIPQHVDSPRTTAYDSPRHALKQAGGFAGLAGHARMLVAEAAERNAPVDPDGLMDSPRRNRTPVPGESRILDSPRRSRTPSGFSRSRKGAADDRE